MSIGHEQRIKDYVTDILYNGNSSGDWIRYIISQESKNYYLDQEIKKLNFSTETFCSGIGDISDSLFCMRKPTIPYIAVLFIFSIKLNTFYKHHYSWYTTDMLIDTLVPILLKVEFNPPYNRCCILYPCLFSCFYP